MSTRAFISWSGGKDCALSLYLAEKENVNVKYLLNIVTEDGKYSRSHGLRPDVIKKQAEYIGAELIQVRTSWEEYEKNFKNALILLKEKGVTAGVFGDIDLEDHRMWVERVCSEVGIDAILPLWGMEREEIFKEFFKAGFRAVICSVKEGVIDKKWLGHELDEKFIKELRKLGTDICGENGEYHTFVYSGPIFKDELRLKFGKVKYRGSYYYIEIAVV